MPKPIKSSLSPYQRFKQRWQGCTKCELCKVRKTVVLCRGRLPCDVLFIGEAPGTSEDRQGEPFVGPAGGLLDQIVCEALHNLNLANLNPVYPDWWRMAPIRLGWTNVICCIPKVEGVKAGEPPNWAVKACAPRLVEFVWLAKPRLVVLVGDHAKKTVVGQNDFIQRPDDERQGPDWLWLDPGQFLEFCSIVHPARLLRLRTENPSWATIEYRRAVVTLTDAFELLSQEIG